MPIDNDTLQEQVIDLSGILLNVRNNRRFLFNTRKEYEDWLIGFRTLSTKFALGLEEYNKKTWDANESKRNVSDRESRKRLDARREKRVETLVNTGRLKIGSVVKTRTGFRMIASINPVDRTFRAYHLHNCGSHYAKGGLVTTHMYKTVMAIMNWHQFGFPDNTYRISGIQEKL